MLEKIQRKKWATEMLILTAQLMSADCAERILATTSK